MDQGLTTSQREAIELARATGGFFRGRRGTIEGYIGRRLRKGKIRDDLLSDLVKRGLLARLPRSEETPACYIIGPNDIQGK
jgi:hypothetical protein